MIVPGRERSQELSRASVPNNEPYGASHRFLLHRNAPSTHLSRDRVSGRALNSLRIGKGPRPSRPAAHALQTRYPERETQDESSSQPLIANNRPVHPSRCNASSARE